MYMIAGMEDVQFRENEKEITVSIYQLSSSVWLQGKLQASKQELKGKQILVHYRKIDQTASQWQSEGTNSGSHFCLRVSHLNRYDILSLGTSLWNKDLWIFRNQEGNLIKDTMSNQAFHRSSQVDRKKKNQLSQKLSTTQKI